MLGSQRRRLGRLVMGIAVLTLSAGCAEASSPPTAATEDVFAGALAEAQEGGAGDAQLAALEVAGQEGGVTIEAAREAARRTVSCMSGVGLDAEYSENTLGDGLVIPGYLVASSESEDSAEADAKIDDCVTRESLWLNKVFQLQASSIEQKEDFANQQEPVLRACLEGHGMATDPDDDGVDLANRAADAVRDSSGAVDCLHEAGIDTW